MIPPTMNTKGWQGRPWLWGFVFVVGGLTSYAGSIEAQSVIRTWQQRIIYVDSLQYHYLRPTFWLCLSSLRLSVASGAEVYSLVRLRADCSRMSNSICRQNIRLRQLSLK